MVVKIIVLFKKKLNIEKIMSRRFQTTAMRWRE